MFEYILICLCIAVLSVNILAEDESKKIQREDINTYETLYNWGIDSYSSERWYECKAFMKLALQDYKHHRHIVLHCHKKCRMLVGGVAQKPAITSELMLFDGILKEALCLQRCRTEAFTVRSQKAIDENVEEAFEKLMPYSFMQLCYWKMDDIEHAVQAAYTYLTRNPNDSMMSKNLEYYRREKNFSEDFLVDLEERKHQTYYMDGLKSYENEDYMQVVDHMERSLEAYWQAEIECRDLCESSFTKFNMEPQLYIHIAKYYADVLKCKVNCPAKLNWIKGNTIPDLLPSHFHYLQFSYWHSQRVQKACEAAATYLVFFPDDEVMVKNKEYFASQYNLDESLFTPRPEVLQYYRRQMLEARQLAFIEEKFPEQDWTSEFPESENADDYKVMNEELVEFEKRLSPFSTELLKEADERSDESPQTSNKPAKGQRPSYPIANNVKKIVENNNMNLVAQHLIDYEQCQQIMSITKHFDESNDSSADNTNEVVKVITTSQIIQLIEKNQVSLEIGKLFLDVSANIRDSMQIYYKLTGLHIQHTSLICRTAKSDLEEKEVDGFTEAFDQVLDGDICLMSPKAHCPYFKEYGAILNLNDNFHGGQFVFVHAQGPSQSEIEAKSGQLIGFSGGSQGVRGVLSGTRCIMALSLTQDQSKKEFERSEAQQKLAEIELMHNT